MRADLRTLLIHRFRRFPQIMSLRAQRGNHKSKGYRLLHPQTTPIGADSERRPEDRRRRTEDSGRSPGPSYILPCDPPPSVIRSPFLAFFASRRENGFLVAASSLQPSRKPQKRATVPDRKGPARRIFLFPLEQGLTAFSSTIVTRFPRHIRATPGKQGSAYKCARIRYARQESQGKSKEEKVKSSK